MPIRRDFKLYLNAGRSIPLVINASQYDRGEKWYFLLYSETGEQYYPDSAAIVGTKADGNLIANAAETDGRGYVIVTETEQMTAAAGKNKFELLIDDQTHGTANFVLLVEPSPADEGVPSESDLSLIQQAIDGTSATAIAAGVAAWMSEHLTPTTPVVDQSLTVQGAAADSKKVGDELSDLKSQISQNQGMSEEFKVALENFAKAVVFKTDVPDGQTYIDALHTAMNPPANLTRIGAVYTQDGDVFDTDSLDSLKSDLVVTAYYSNGTSTVVGNYALSGQLNQAVSVITVTYGGKTTTFNVNVIVPVFDYLASRDGLLSEFSGITKFTDNDSKWSERMSEETNLRIEGSTGASYLQFKIGDNPTTGKWRLRIKFELYSVTSTETQVNGLRPQLSDGTSGIRVGFGRNGIVNAFEGATSGTPTNIGQITTGFVWHDMELYLDTSEPIQRITIDGNVLLESASLATGFGNNSVFFTNTCIVFVKYIKLYNQ